MASTECLPTRVLALVGQKSSDCFYKVTPPTNSRGSGTVPSTPTDGEDLKQRTTPGRRPPTRLPTTFKEEANEKGEADVQDAAIKLKEYEGVKHKMTALSSALELFSNSIYRTEAISILKPKPPHVMQAYQYKIDAFTPDIKAKYAKDLALHAGNDLYVIKPRQEDSVFGAPERANVSINVCS